MRGAEVGARRGLGLTAPGPSGQVSDCNSAPASAFALAAGPRARYAVAAGSTATGVALVDVISGARVFASSATARASTRLCVVGRALFDGARRVATLPGGRWRHPAGIA